MEMRTKRRWIAWMVIGSGVLSPGSAGAQNREAKTEAMQEIVGTIRGRVVDADTRLPLAGVAVAARSLDLVARPAVLSGEDGGFVIRNVEAGSYTLGGSVLGYAPELVADVVVRSGRITMVEMSMQPAPIALEGIVVKGGFFRKPKEEVTSQTRYSGEEIRRAPGSAGDVSRIFMTLPSVAKVSDQSNGLAIRGGSPAENAFFVDNIEIPNINHFPAQGSSSGPISLLTTDLIKDATFHTGGFSARYGNRLSSVMNIELRDGNPEEFDAQFDLNFAGVGVSAEGPLGGGSASYLVSVRRSYLDLLVNAIGTNADMVPKYSDGTVKVAWELGARHRLVGLGIIGLDDIAIGQSAAVDNDITTYGDQDMQEGAVGVDWQALWSDGMVSNTTVSFMTTGYGGSVWETSSDQKLVQQDSRESSLTFRNTNRAHLGRGASLQFGVEATALFTDYDLAMSEYTGSLGQPVPALRVGDRFTTGRGALFASLVADPLPRVTTTFGLRADHFHYSGDWSVSPRAALTFRATDRTNLNLSGGLFRQDLPLVLLTQQEENRELAEPWAAHLVGGVEHFLSDDTRLTVEGYWKEYRDSPVDPAEPGLFIVDEQTYRYGFFFNHDQLASDGRARARGVELLIQKKLAEGFYGLLAGSYSRAEYEAGDGIWRSRVYDNRWMASAEGGYKPNDLWEFSLRWVFAGGAPFTPLDLEASAAAGRDVLDKARINQARYPDYHSLNVRLDRRMNFQGSNLVWYASVWNVYNRKNVAGYYWNGLKSKLETSYQWGMLPVFGLEWEF